jgi:hypothetical protein
MRIGDARDDRDGLLHMIVSRARVETDNRKNASRSSHPSRKTTLTNPRPAACPALTKRK